MCADIGVDANDLAVFIFAWHCQAATLGEFAWDEFRRGAEELHIDSLAKFKERVETMRAELVDPVAFKRFYVFVFQYGREGACAMFVRYVLCSSPLRRNPKIARS